jgi:hypothetical protein
MLSDNQRRTICRIAFLVGCLAPTLGLIYAIFHRPTAADWARNIKAELGVEATIEGIETPWPGVTILRGVKFLDPEAGRLFEATEVKLELDESANRIVIDQKLSLTNTGLIKLVQLINEHPLRRHGVDRPWLVYFNDLVTIYETKLSDSNPTLGQTLTIENTQIEVRPRHKQDGTEMQVRFQIAGEPIVLSPDQHVLPEPVVDAYLARSFTMQDGSSDLLLELDTKGAALPCWLLGDLVSELKGLGAKARFAGSLTFVPKGGDSVGRIQGRFSQLDRSQYYATGAVEALDLYCSFNRGVKEGTAELVPQNIRIPVAWIEPGQPLQIDRVITAALEEPLQAQNIQR